MYTCPKPRDKIKEMRTWKNYNICLNKKNTRVLARTNLNTDKKSFPVS